MYMTNDRQKMLDILTQHSKKIETQKKIKEDVVDNSPLVEAMRKLNASPYTYGANKSILKDFIQQYTMDSNSEDPFK